MDIRQIMRDYIVENLLFGDEERLPADSLQEGRVLDSLGVLDIITFIEGKFGIEIADDDMIPENFNTLSGISRLIERKMNAGTIARQTVSDRVGESPLGCARESCAASLAPVASRSGDVGVASPVCGEKPYEY